MLVNEFDTKVYGLSDLLLYNALVDDGILYQHDGSLLAAWAYEGHDFGSATRETLMAITSQISASLNLGSDWMIETDVCRRAVTGYPATYDHAHPVARVIDEERRRQFQEPDAYFSSQAFITLTYLPPPIHHRRLTSWFKGEAKEATSEAELGRLARQSLDHFKTFVQTFESDFRAHVKLTRLRQSTVTDEMGNTWQDHKLLRFLRECVLGEDYPFSLPDVPNYLHLLFSGEVNPGNPTKGEPPQLDNRYIRVIGAERYPAGSFPSMFWRLEQLPFAYRFHTRTILFDPEVSKHLHEQDRRAWRGNQRSLLAQACGFGGGRPGSIEVDLEIESAEAMKVSSRGLVQFGAFDANVVLLDSNLTQLNGHTGLVRDAFKHGAGFGPRVETTNTLEAWRGTFNGNGYANVRRGKVHTLNLAQSIPLHTPFTGHAQSRSPYMDGAPALLRAVTDGATPFDFQPHYFEIGHTALFGPTRYGKSFFAALMIAQWLARYPQGQVFAFDKRTSLEVLLTAMDGRYFPFAGSGKQMRLCPLEDITEPENLAWANWWVGHLYDMNRLALSPPQHNHISDTLLKLAGRPDGKRSLTQFASLLGHSALKDGLQCYTAGSGASQGVLDGQADELSLDETRFALFEMENLFNMDPKIRGAVMPYLFRRITKRLDSRKPTLILMDESWVGISDRVIAEVLRSWLKETAKLNAAVVLCTQNLSDVFDSGLSDIIIDQCQTKIFTGIPSAAGTSRKHFEGLRLTVAQIDAIANGRKQQDYFIQRPDSFRRIELNPGKVALAFCGSNSDEQKAKFRDLVAKNPAKALALWLEHSGVPDWADYLQSLFDKREAERRKENQLYACAS